MAQGLFGVVVGGRHSVDPKEGKETVVIAFGIYQALAEGFRFLVGDLFFTNEIQSAVEGWDLGLGFGEGYGPRVSKFPQVTGIAKEFAQLGVKA